MSSLSMYFLQTKLFNKRSRLCENSEFGCFRRFSLLRIDPLVVQFNESGQ